MSFRILKDLPIEDLEVAENLFDNENWTVQDYLWLTFKKLKSLDGNVNRPLNGLPDW